MNHGRNDVKQFVSNITRYVKDTSGNEFALPKVQKLFETLSSRAAGERIAYITTAIELSDVDKDSIKQAVSHLIGRELSISVLVDKTVLGGIKISIGDWVYDGTLSYQLSTLSRELRI
jgi:F-type H+-transporting ATPase subunit delta